MIQIQDLPNYYKTVQHVIVLNDQAIYNDNMSRNDANLARDNKIKDLENSVKLLTESIQTLMKLVHE